MLRISTVEGHKRMSTQELLQTISRAVENGERDFYISASGQHDIGGPLWSKDGAPLNFTVANPGQRVGSMCLPNTKITVEGPAPADAGWLNSGGIISIRGDAGDTAGHCAAAGKIFIGGRAGARTGALMKHDPEREPPELWILRSTGSFSFEFMGGGKAIVCGHDSQTLPSVLGERPGVGMVGGVIYFRGPCLALPDDVDMLELDDGDISWLEAGLDDFLLHVAQTKLKRELSVWKHWRKLVPAQKTHENKTGGIAEFRARSWFSNGLFGDVLHDDMRVIPLTATGACRLQIPVWSEHDRKCVDCRACIEACPRGAVRRREKQKGGQTAAVYDANASRCIGCGICAAVCPQKIWKMEKN